MRKQPSTSREANNLKSAESKNRDYKRIKEALAVLGVANYDTIARHIGVKDANVVSRRMKELCLLGEVRNTETKSLTSRNRNAFNYCLINQPKTENGKKVEKSLSGKGVSDYSKAIQEVKKEAPVYIQQSLL